MEMTFSLVLLVLTICTRFGIKIGLSREVRTNISKANNNSSIEHWQYIGQSHRFYPPLESWCKDEDDDADDNGCFYPNSGDDRLFRAWDSTVICLGGVWMKLGGHKNTQFGMIPSCFRLPQVPMVYN